MVIPVGRSPLPPGSERSTDSDGGGILDIFKDVAEGVGDVFDTVRETYEAWVNLDLSIHAIDAARSDANRARELAVQNTPLANPYNAGPFEDIPPWVLALVAGGAILGVVLLTSRK